MTVTASSFRAAFTAFSSTTAYSDAEIEFWIAFALLQHNAVRWGNSLDMGVMLFIAHNLALEANAKKAQASGQGAGAIVGTLTSITADKVSWTRAPAPTNPADGHWGLTSYGLRWKQLARMFGSGGIQVGVPSPDDVNAGQGAWAGPFPSPF